MLGLLLAALFAWICYSMGSSKGYSGVICALAGFFGSIFAIIVIALLPDRAAEKEQYDWQERRNREEMAALKRRISELEAAQKTAEPQEAVEQPEGSNEGTPAPAVFASRALDTIACPNCGRKQRSTRDNCYNCGTRFLYEDER